MAAILQSLPAGSVTNATIADGSNVDADKLQQIYNKGSNFGLVIGGTPTDQEFIVHVVTAANGGTIREFHSTLNVSGSTSDIDFDLKVNGTTVLSAKVNHTNADADKLIKDGTISSAAVSQDDIISIECDQTTNTGAQGPFAWVVLEEDF